MLMPIPMSARDAKGAAAQANAMRRARLMFILLGFLEGDLPCDI
jgi:hypothetical protein